MYSKKDSILNYVFKKTNAKLCLALGSLSENFNIYIYLNFQNSKKSKRSNKSEDIFFELSEFKKFKKQTNENPKSEKLISQ
jgi:hypothetical protein